MYLKRLMLSLVIFLTVSNANAALLKLEGEISSSETVQAKLNDEIIVVNNSGIQVSTNTETHSVISDSGIYTVQIDKPLDFNGTELGIQLKQGNKVYQLLQGEKAVIFTFFGGELLPIKKTLNVTIGKLIREEADDNDNNGSEEDGDNDNQKEEVVDINTSYDVDDDGKLTQADITAVKRALTKKNTRADVNNDGIINTRDIIDVIKAVRRQNRPR